MSNAPDLKKVKKHRLILFDILSRRLRNKLLLLLVILLGLGVYDLYEPILADDVWFYFWIVIFLVFLLWLYYAFLMPRASVQARPKSLRLQGPLYAINISYGRIHSVTSAKMRQHYPYERLKSGEKGILKPLYKRTGVFIELNSYPGAFRWRHLWFPRHLFGTSRTGLFCVVEDWMALSRDLAVYSDNRYERVHKEDREKSVSLVTRVLGES